MSSLLPSLYDTRVLLYAPAALLVLFLVKTSADRLRLRQATQLRGPKSSSWFLGMSRDLLEADLSVTYENYVAQYGPVFSIPGMLGSSRVVLCDPRAITHFYSKETWTYQQIGFARQFISNLFGRGLLWAEAESHRRQRKALTPAFSVAEIRRITSVFYDSVYTAKTVWDDLLEASPSSETVIDVQDWMNRIALDSIGIAGFAHDFRTLHGARSVVVELFASFGSISQDSLLSVALFGLSFIFPWMVNLPTKRNRVMLQLKSTMRSIADELLKKTRQEGAFSDGDTRAAEKSLIGLLIKSENKDEELNLSNEEVLAQMNLLLVAGYETTSISLTWALIELSRNPEMQNKLREELYSLGTTDPTYDQLMNGLPYLDAIVHEILRMNPPVSDTMREAVEDDIIPLSSPIITANGEMVSSLVVKKGQMISAPIRYANRAEAFWGPDAKDFVPERWLDDGDEKKMRGARELIGHRRLLTFSDGPRICLGKSFALAEFKAVLTVLIRNFEFSFPGPNGANTKIEKHKSLLPRPGVEGEGMRVPLLVKRVSDY